MKHGFESVPPGSTKKAKGNWRRLVSFSPRNQGKSKQIKVNQTTFGNFFWWARLSMDSQKAGGCVETAAHRRPDD